MATGNSTLLAEIAIAGAGISAGIVFVVGNRKAVRHLVERHHGRSERRVRPMLLESIAEGTLDARLLRARGSRGRAVERVAVQYLAKTRGEAREVLEELLARRGFGARTIRQTSRWGPHRRARAAELLGVVASTEARHCLERLGRLDRKPEVRMVAARALGKFGTADAAASLLGLLYYATPVPEGIVAAGLVELGPEAISALRDVLRLERRGSVIQRAMAADVLGLLEAVHAWRDLAAEATGTDPETRVSAVRALGRLGVPGAADTIAECLQPEESAQLRSVAARALGRVGDARFAALLAACVDDPDYEVAHHAAEALTALGAPGQRALTRLATQPSAGSMHAREALAYAGLQRLGYLAWKAAPEPISVEPISVEASIAGPVRWRAHLPLVAMPAR